ncbi:hypothetical protein SLEP1_g19906 [Rubroshorea leprosula]|uniref:Uncharacterized protein n=2 Tax=Rubroshorea leprosula TaxID=152421 RepID=A0AAV5JBG0_9ROSI|nr:hypothetical protein SLEP1_g19906 [Rubroshorea leprosula]
MIPVQQNFQPAAAMESQQPGDKEAAMEVQQSSCRRGGWVTFPFIAATLSGLILCGWGWVANLIVYLIQEFNVKSIDATQINNVINGSTNLLPIVAAILIDSFFGSFYVIAVSSCSSVLGTVLLTLTASITSLRPPPCKQGSSVCHAPTRVQIGLLYVGIALAAIGIGGTRFALASMGANQFDRPKDVGVFFNWYFFILYTTFVISSTVIVYIQDSISWGLGFGLCVAASTIGLAIFLLGKRFYRHEKPQGSPYTTLARVLVAAIRKKNLPLSPESVDYYHGNDGINQNMVSTPTQSFRFLNHAALKSEGDIQTNGSIANPWRLCTVQQVEDLKALVRIFPLWSSSIFLSIPIAIQGSMTVLQALTMDRHLGSHFKIPVGSFVVVVLISTSIFISILDRFLIPAWQKLTGQSPTHLQLIGVGHVLNVLSMVTSALVESRRLKIARGIHLEPGSVVPMLSLWLFPQLVLVGIGEAFHFPGQVALYYQEFPLLLRSTSTASVSLIIGIAFYTSTALVDLIRHVTEWLPNNINDGRLDNVYWTLVVVGSLNFGYFIVCSRLYRHRNIEEKVVDSVGSGNEESRTEQGA